MQSTNSQEVSCQTPNSLPLISKKRLLFDPNPFDSMDSADTSLEDFNTRKIAKSEMHQSTQITVSAKEREISSPVENLLKKSSLVEL